MSRSATVIIETSYSGCSHINRNQRMASRRPCAGKDHVRGCIITTESVAAFGGQKGQVLYSASTSGVVGMSLPMACDLAEHRIRVMTTVPGLPENVLHERGASIPYSRSRLVDPEEYGQLVFRMEKSFDFTEQFACPREVNGISFSLVNGPCSIPHNDLCNQTIG